MVIVAIIIGIIGVIVCFTCSIATLYMLLKPKSKNEPIHIVTEFPEKLIVEREEL